MSDNSLPLNTQYDKKEVMALARIVISLNPFCAKNKVGNSLWKTKARCYASRIKTGRLLDIIMRKKTKKHFFASDNEFSKRVGYMPTKLTIWVWENPAALGKRYNKCPRYCAF